VIVGDSGDAVNSIVVEEDVVWKQSMMLGKWKEMRAIFSRLMLITRQFQKSL
jgi:hypothetical protein